VEVLLWGHPPSAPAPPAPSPAQVATPTSTPTPPPTVGPETPPAPAVSSDSVPLQKDEILQMLQNGLPGEQVADLVEESGIDFEPTEDYYKTLRKAGADDALIGSLRKAKRVKP